MAPSSVDFDLTGEVALVTGATSGFGWHFAEVLSAAGATVVLTGRRVERLQALQERILAAGGVAHAVALDVTSVDSMRVCVDEAERLAGPLTVLVNNAGISIQSSAAKLGEAGWDAVMDTNVKGTFFMAQLIGSRMIERGIKGRSVNVASIGAMKALPGLVAYSTVQGRGGDADPGAALPAFSPGRVDITRAIGRSDVYCRLPQRASGAGSHGPMAADPG